MLRTLLPSALSLIFIHVLFYYIFPGGHFDEGWFVHFWPLFSACGHVLWQKIVGNSVDSNQGASEEVIAPTVDVDNDVKIVHGIVTDPLCITQNSGDDSSVSAGAVEVTARLDVPNYPLHLRNLSVVIRKEDYDVAEQHRLGDLNITARSRHHSRAPRRHGHPSSNQ